MKKINWFNLWFWVFFILTLSSLICIALFNFIPALSGILLCKSICSILENSLLSAFSTLCVGFCIVDNFDLVSISKKFRNHEFLNQMVVLDALSKMNIDTNKIINDHIDYLEHKNKKSFSEMLELDTYKKLKYDNITPAKAYKNFLHDLCKKYTEMYLRNQTSQEDT